MIGAADAAANLLCEFNIAAKKEDKKAIEQNNKSNDNNQEENSGEGTEEEDDDEGLNVSLAAMEEKLKPKVLKDFDDITKLFKKLHHINVL